MQDGWARECWVRELLTHVGAHTRHTRSGLVRPAHARVDIVLHLSDGGTENFILLGLYVR